MIILEQDIQESNEYTEKVQEYLDYIDNHVRYVKESYDNYFKLLPYNETLTVGNLTHEEFVDAIKKAKEHVENHDASKYDDIEFYPYRRHFHKTIAEKELDAENIESDNEEKENFKKAFEHHYQNNPHHIQYWYDFENAIPKDMTVDYIIEMICDWISMSIIFNNASISSWWEDQNESAKERSMMTPETINIINEIYDIIKK